MKERKDTGEVSYRGEETFPGSILECRDVDCFDHYVVRLDGTWVRGFHNERDAREFADELREMINR